MTAVAEGGNVLVAKGTSMLVGKTVGLASAGSNLGDVGVGLLPDTSTAAEVAGALAVTAGVDVGGLNNLDMSNSRIRSTPKKLIPITIEVLRFSGNSGLIRNGDTMAASPPMIAATITAISALPIFCSFCLYPYC
jgi:Leucine-rich repeat (LRR) protein